jgi:hypothetical protein
MHNKDSKNVRFKAYNPFRIILQEICIIILTAKAVVKVIMQVLVEAFIQTLIDAHRYAGFHFDPDPDSCP